MSSWTWERLRTTLGGLELSRDDYVVGLAGAMLANESVVASDEVVLLVTDQLFVELDQRGWQHDYDLGGLQCPTEPGLFVRAGDVSDTYTAPIPTLVVEAWTQDNIPVVSVLQIDQASVRQFLEGALADDEVSPARPVSMAWTWERLRTAIPRLELPEGQFVVGLSGTLLANESLTTVEEVELLVTPTIHDQLLARDWFGAGDGPRLLCAYEDDLYARSGGFDDTYTVEIPVLIDEAWREDGVPCVSMVQVRQAAVRAALSAGRP